MHIHLVFLALCTQAVLLTFALPHLATPTGSGSLEASTLPGPSAEVLRTNHIAAWAELTAAQDNLKNVPISIPNDLPPGQTPTTPNLISPDYLKAVRRVEEAKDNVEKAQDAIAASSEITAAEKVPVLRLQRPIVAEELAKYTADREKEQAELNKYAPDDYANRHPLEISINWYNTKIASLSEKLQRIDAFIAANSPAAAA